MLHHESIANSQDVGGGRALRPGEYRLRRVCRPQQLCTRIRRSAGGLSPSAPAERDDSCLGSNRRQPERAGDRRGPRTYPKTALSNWRHLHSRRPGTGESAVLTQATPAIFRKASCKRKKGHGFPMALFTITKILRSAGVSWRRRSCHRRELQPDPRSLRQRR